MSIIKNASNKIIVPNGHPVVSANKAIVISTANLAGWWDASQLTGKVDGDAISSWTDFSGNTRHATQATGSKQPLYKTNQINGFPSILFASASAQALTSAAFTGLSNYTLFIVHSPVSASATTAFSHNTASPSKGFRFDLSSSTVLAIIDTSVGNTTVTLLSSTVSSILAAYHIDEVYNDGTLCYIRHDGTTKFGNAAGVTSFDPNKGASIGWSGDAGAVRYYNGYIAEVILYGRALTFMEVKKIERYLRAKYNVIL